MKNVNRAFINNIFDFTNNPKGVAFEIYCVDETSLKSRIKGWLINMKFRWRAK